MGGREGGRWGVREGQRESLEREGGRESLERECLEGKQKLLILLSPQFGWCLYNHSGGGAAAQ